MVSRAVRSLRVGSRALRPPAGAWGPPARVWRDWALVGVLVPWAVLEWLLHPELAWRPVTLVVALVVVLGLLWRRTHPLAVVLVAFGSLAAVDGATILVAPGTEPALWATACVLLLPYSLGRWAAGRKVAIGLAVILAWYLLRTAAHPPDGAAEAVVGGMFFLFGASLGIAIRFRTHARLREIDQVKLQEREQLARELHDTVAHHVSAIAIQAQAGRTVAATHPESAVQALEIIEEAASRTLAEMRTMVGVLRDTDEPDLAPQPGVMDIERLARTEGDRPRVDVTLEGDLDDLNPSIGTALYRLAQESVTNALRHARHATRVSVHVTGERDEVRLTVSDDGDAPTTARDRPGYGLVGMTERATLLGGTLEAGPSSGQGWTVSAMLPRTGSTR